jgi:ribonuclease D
MLDAVKSTKKHLIAEIKPKLFSSAQEELRSLRKAPKLTITQMEIFLILWEWRNNHSRIVDEAPRLLIPSQVLIHLAKYPPSTEEKIKEAFNGRIPHLLEKATKTIMRLVNEGRPYLAKLEATICNNCGEAGHAAYGCYLPNSWQNTKRYYDNHPELKARQNRRRRENKKNNKIAKQHISSQ